MFLSNKVIQPYLFPKPVEHFIEALFKVCLHRLFRALF